MLPRRTLAQARCASPLAGEVRRWVEKERAPRTTLGARRSVPAGAGYTRGGLGVVPVLSRCYLAPPDAGRPTPGWATSPQPPYPQDDGSGWGEAEEQRVPESWYRSSNVDTSSRLGDTGEIPVVHVPPEGEDQEPRRHPRQWRD